MTCADCKSGVAGQRVWFEVVGWEQPRQQGGTNHVAARENTGRVLCNYCMDKRKRGLSKDQGSLI